MSRQCMCGGDDHLAWKRLVSSEACRELRIVGGYNRLCQGSFKVHPYPFRATLTLQVESQILRLGLPPYTWVHLRAFRASLVTVRIQYSLFLVSSRECSEIGMSFNISWITFFHVALDYSFHSMNLTCFFSQGFRLSLLAWHILSFGFLLLDVLGYVH